MADKDGGEARDGPDAYVGDDVLERHASDQAATIEPRSGGKMGAKPRVLHIFEEAREDGRPVHVSAPMVRYSKLPFRLLLTRHCNVDIAYTPMILAHEFIRSSLARDSDFTTHSLERQDCQVNLTDGSTARRKRALVAQFASSHPEEFARAGEMIAPWVDGINLNCGCPQSWALKDGIGCSLMSSPSLVAAMVHLAKIRLATAYPDDPKTVSVKIRIHKNLSETIAWVKEVEAAGVDYITVHGRTRSQRSSTPPDLDAIAVVKAAVSCPVIANGDVFYPSDVPKIVGRTGVDGVMAARGLLENPALFAGYGGTPAEAVRRLLGYCIRCPIPFALVVHHLGEMIGKMEGVGKKGRRELMGCRDLMEVVDWVEKSFGMEGGEGRVEVADLQQEVR